MSDDTDSRQPVTFAGRVLGEPMYWNGEHALEALNAGLPPGTYGKVRETPLMRFEITSVCVTSGVIGMAAARIDDHDPGDEDRS